MKVHELIKQLQDLKADGADVVIYNEYEACEEQIATVEADDDHGVVVLTARPDHD